jgi:hypothetical protein
VLSAIRPLAINGQAAEAEVFFVRVATMEMLGFEALRYAPAERFVATKGAAHFQGVHWPAGLAEEGTPSNPSTSATSGAARADDGNTRTRGPELPSDIPTGQIIPKVDIDDDGIDLSPMLQVPKSLVCVACFQYFIAGVA